MKALFIHDHPFIKNKGTDLIYTSGNLNSELWSRYLCHFDSVTVIGRCKTETDTLRYNLATREKVIFKLFENVKGGSDYFKKRAQIEKKLKEEINQHDVVIIRFPATIGVFAAEYCIKKNIRYIAEVVGCSWDSNWNYGGILAKLIAPYSYIKMKRAVLHSFATIYVTECFLQDRYPTEAKITANASNVILKEVEEEALSSRLKKIEKGSDHIHIGIIGNLSVKYKGYDVLLKAISTINHKDIKDSIKVSFVGGGDQVHLKSLIKQYDLEDQSAIIGKLRSGKEIFDFLDTLDLYVHPSKQEGLPRVVIEAMSRACPVLASSVAGTPEIINRAYLHRPGDAKKLSQDIVAMVNNKEQLIGMAQENFQNSKKYLFSTLEKRRFEFFKELNNSL